MRHLRDRTRARCISWVSAAGILAASLPALAQQPEELPPLPPLPPAPTLPPANGASSELEEAERALEEAQRNLEAAVEEAARERERRASRGYVIRSAGERERQGALDESRGELERARRELDAARRRLEEAARDVARLSARAVAPIVEDFQVQWLGADQRAMLGVVVEDDRRGARVTAVSPGGPADEAGVEIGDVIVSIDGRALDANGRGASRILIDHLRDVEPGETVSLEVVRRGETRSIDVETSDRRGRLFAFEAPRVQVFTRLLRPGSDRWSSMELVPLTPTLGAYFGTERGLLVVRAPDDASLKLEDGDVILDINGRAPNSPEHAMKILGSFEEGETIELNIMRHGQPMTLEIPVSESEPEASRSNGGAA